MKRKLNWLLPVLLSLALLSYLLVWPWYRDRPANAAAEALIADLTEHGQQAEQKAGAMPVLPERLGRAELIAQAELLASELAEVSARGDALIQRAKETLPRTPGGKHEQLRRALEEYTARLQSALAAYNARRTLLREKLREAKARD